MGRNKEWHDLIMIFGPSGSGKTTLVKWLQGQGCAALDLDMVGRRSPNNEWICPLWAVKTLYVLITDRPLYMAGICHNWEEIYNWAKTITKSIYMLHMELSMIRVAGPRRDLQERGKIGTEQGKVKDGDWYVTQARRLYARANQLGILYIDLISVPILKSRKPFEIL